MDADLAIEFASGQTVVVRLRGENTMTVNRLRSALPIESTAHRWGDEVYFEAPFHADLEEDARQDMEVGDVAFWPDGDAIAVFFGRTPVSKGLKPRAYSPCNMVGRLVGDVAVLRSVNEGARLVVKRL